MLDELLDCRLPGEIDQELYAAKATELRDEEAEVKELIDGIDQRRSDESDLVADTLGGSRPPGTAPPRPECLKRTAKCDVNRGSMPTAST